MTLPQIFNPTYDITVPSLKKKLKFRQFLVKEEKILLMAKESKDPSDILKAEIQIVTNCSMDPNFDINKLALFDLEYIFLKLRMYSVDNICDINYSIPEDGVTKQYNFKIDLNDVEVAFPDKISNKIAINDQVGIIMKYPMATLYQDDEYLSIKKDVLYNTILRCISQIYDGENIYEAKDYKLEEISDFVEKLSPKVYEKIMEFLQNLPGLYYKIDYENSKKENKSIELKQLADFFTLR